MTKRTWPERRLGGNYFTTVVSRHSGDDGGHRPLHIPSHESLSDESPHGRACPSPKIFPGGTEQLGDSRTLSPPCPPPPLDHLASEFLV